MIMIKRSIIKFPPRVTTTNFTLIIILFLKITNVLIKYLCDVIRRITLMMFITLHISST